jgi:hypothetical protein
VGWWVSDKEAARSGLEVCACRNDVACLQERIFRTCASQGCRAPCLHAFCHVCRMHYNSVLVYLQLLLVIPALVLSFALCG